ncbi:putative reverse transcriptase domain-containing protein [Tanacetum coccineum]
MSFPVFINSKKSSGLAFDDKPKWKKGHLGFTSLFLNKLELVDKALKSTYTLVLVLAKGKVLIRSKIVTQVTNNVNNANANGGNGGNGNGGNNGCSYKAFLACNPRDYDGKGGAVALTRWIEKMESVIENSRCAENQKVKFVMGYFIGVACGRVLTQSNEMESSESESGIILCVRCGTLTRSSEKRKEVEETSKQGGSWKDNKKAKVGKGFVATAPPRNVNVGAYPKADFSFISTKFAPLLDVKPSIVSHVYVIEVANGKKEEVDRIIHDCKQELGNSLFTIDLIPLGHGSFDVIVGMDWLSKYKAEIVCHEKVVRIQLKGGEILRVEGERTLGYTKTLMSTKAEEPELGDIPII